MAGCGGVCACRRDFTTTVGRTAVVASSTGHLGGELRRSARDRGLEVRSGSGALWVSGPGLIDWLLALDGGLSSTERAEVRVAFTEHGQPGEDIIAALLQAQSLAAVATRLRTGAVQAVLSDPSAFFSVYQPIVSLADGRPVAYEALLRGRHEGEEISAGAILATAEEAGHLHVVDRIGRESAIRGAGGWLGDARLFINFNPTSIYRPELCLATTERAAREAGLALEQLVFEVVESHHVSDLDHLSRVFEHYRRLGCSIALDDVGAGYSGLTTLAALQPEVVKLDGALVRALPDAGALAVVRAVVAMTHDIGGLVIAECVETAEQAAIVQGLGVDWAQGWYFGHPATGGTPAPVVPVPAARTLPLPATPASDVAAEVPADLRAVLQRALAASGTAIVVSDATLPDNPVVYANAAFEHVTGYAAADIIGRNCRVLQGPGTDPATVTYLRERLTHGEEARARLVNHRPDGTPWWNELRLSPVRDARGRLTHYIGVQDDVTAQVLREQQAAHDALHDPLTGVANRRHVLEELDRALAAARRRGQQVALVYVDLDDFKAVNDTLGHAAGDEVLVTLARRLGEAVRAEDILARLGGDEFLVLLTALDPATVDEAVHRLLQHIEYAVPQPVTAAGRPVCLGASAGTAVFPRDGDTAEALLAVADAGMYRAKAAGRTPGRLWPAATT